MVDELTPCNPKTAVLLHEARVALKALANHLKANDEAVTVLPEDRADFLDAIIDQIVTGTGVGQHCGFPVVDALAEVNESNWSKFDDDGQPIVDANGKIMKGQAYFKASLDQFVPKYIPVFDTVFTA